MPITYLAKIGELSLKGGNKKSFEQKLISMFSALCQRDKVTKTVYGGRMYVECEEEDALFVERALSHLIGITGWAKTETCKKNMDEILKIAVEIAKKARSAGSTTFKIEARREDKTFSLNSQEIACIVGDAIHTSNILATDLHSPDITITIEIRKKAFIYALSHKGIQGLPVSSSGKGLLLLSGGIDSPVAGYKMLCRGMRVDCLYFHSYPYTSDEAREKVEKLASVLARYQVPSYLNIISFTHIQNRIKEVSPESYLTLMMRVCMMNLASSVAEKIEAQCIITGESLSQVASQTIENLTIVDNCATYPVLRPLIGMNKEEIIKEARNLGSYELSILPYDDCCSLFAPKHPILYANEETASSIFKKLEIEDLLKEALDGRVVKKLTSSYE